ncbi:MAG: hypothetical protein ACHQ0Y_13490, partial [Thermodesulfovibrionales bacterium]
MILDVVIDKDSMSIEITDPFHLDLDGIVGKIDQFSSSKGISIGGIDVRGLVPAMIKGIAGCERGCPADAKGLVSKGFKDFELQYIEGGILSARRSIGDGRLFYLKM